MTQTDAFPTREEVERLKKSWAEDPSWDIEDTEGYESYREELLAFSQEMRTKWDAEHEARAAKERQRVEGFARELGCSVELVRYIESLERRILQLENDQTSRASPRL